MGYNVKFLEMVELARERLEKLQSPQTKPRLCVGDKEKFDASPNHGGKTGDTNIQKAKEEVYNKDFCGDGE